MRKPHRMGRAGARSNDASDPRRGGKPGKSGERPSKPGRFSKQDHPVRQGKPGRAGKPATPNKPERAGGRPDFAKPDRAPGRADFANTSRSDKQPSKRKPSDRHRRAEKNDRPEGRARVGDRPSSPPRGRDVRPDPRPPQRTSAPPVVAPAPVPQVATGVQTVTIKPDESGMRLDRFFEARFPGLSFSHIQRIIRKGEVRVNGKRAHPKDRLEAGQAVRIPPLKVNAPKSSRLTPEDDKTLAFLKSITLHEDDDVLVLNKPMGLSVQGGSGTTRHVDGMLEVMRQPGVDGQRPRLVHRLDKDTAGCLLVAKTRFAATALAKTFRTRSARKIYWALVAGVPKPRQGRVSTFLAKEEREEESFMRIAEHGDEGASHAITYYAVVDTSAHTLAWVSLKPVTGRTHQLRAHMAHVGNPIVGDPKYFRIENWELPGGMQNRLHLMARRIAVPHPRGGTIDVTAPLPPHMQQSWNLLGLDAARYDPIVEAPEE
jgi:23S rRNA pseudouridine955/2504/2580 synthase